MSVSAKHVGYTLAAATAALFLTVGPGTAFAGAEQGKVKCEASTACKGHGECKTASNECKGHNACKGTGWTWQKSEADCKAAQSAAKA